MYLKTPPTLILLICIKLSICFEISSVGNSLLAGSLKVGAFLRDNTFCRLKECCTDHYIPANFDVLEFKLDRRVYGQQLASGVVLDALRSHWGSPHAEKALTLSFHGPPGTGKNYVTNFVIETVYKLGADSKFVHQFMGRHHFPLQAKVDEYKMELYELIKSNVMQCPHQLFVFDEVEKMPMGVLDVLKPMIGYHKNVDKVDYRKCVFIFLSNTGSSIISNKMLQLWSEGKQPGEIKLSDFDKIVQMGAFNEIGGFQHSVTIESNLIDHYIPFMPMQLEEVTMCIYDEFRKRGLYDPKQEHVDEILNYVNWGPANDPKFAITGCKRLSQLVAVVVEKYKRNMAKHMEL